MAKLVLSTKGAIVDQCWLDDAQVTIGRATGNRIVVDDPAVAEAHASVSAVGHDYILEGVAGGSGIAVNGTPMKRRILQHGDVVELGAFHLKYVDSKTSSQLDLERTMLISGLNLDPDTAPAKDSGEVTQDLHIPATRATKSRFPSGRVRFLRGARSGETTLLDRVITMVGTPGKAQAVVTRRPHGYYVTFVEGSVYPRVNGESIGKEARHLHTGDILEVGDEKIEFELL